MLRLIFSAIIIAAAGFLFLRFAPTDIKQKGAEFIAKNEIVPEQIRETASNILYTPTEQREQLIAELETQLNELETAAAEPDKIDSEKIKELVKKSEESLAKLKAKNNTQPSLANLAAEKLLSIGVTKNESCEQDK